jgi:hypothetical protein
LYGLNDIPLREPQGAFLDAGPGAGRRGIPAAVYIIMTIQQMMSRLPKKAGARFFVATPDK